MEPLLGFLLHGYAYVTSHLSVLLMLLAGYFFWPGMITGLFQKLEDAVNKIKFSMWGYQVDFSQFEWDDELNHFLRDHVISMMDQASKIKNDMADGTVDPEAGATMLENLTHTIVTDFQVKAPAYLMQYATDKFGGDRIAAAEFLFRRIKAIVFDIQAKKN